MRCACCMMMRSGQMMNAAESEDGQPKNTAEQQTQHWLTSARSRAALSSSGRRVDYLGPKWCSIENNVNHFCRLIK